MKSFLNEIFFKLINNNDYNVLHTGDWREYQNITEHIQTFKQLNLH